jgi:hypothetical protein
MTVSKRKSRVPIPSTDELLKQNPQADGTKVREAQEFITELRRGGVGRTSYDIDSPYERTPMRKPESTTEDR